MANREPYELSEPYELYELYKPSPPITVQYRLMNIETLAIHAGQEPDPVWGAVMTPIVLSSTFAQESPGQHKGFEYSRSGNPTRDLLAEALAEHGVDESGEEGEGELKKSVCHVGYPDSCLVVIGAQS